MRISAPFCNLVSAVVATSIGLITLIGITTGYGEIITAFFLQSVVVTAAIGLLIGILNLFSVHLGRLSRLEHGSPYSLILIISAVAVMVLHVLNFRTKDTEQRVSYLIFETLQVTLESALAGLMFFFLLYAAYKLAQRRLTLSNGLFMVALLLALIGWLPLGLISDVRTWLLEVPATGGARGLLIGVALGTLVAGIRVLIGQDQAYREQ